MARDIRVEERVSKGIEVVGRTKQSSMSGRVAPSVKVSFATIPGKGAGVVVEGMPPLATGRYCSVHNETSVPSIVGSPVRLKYLSTSINSIHVSPSPKHC